MTTTEQALVVGVVVLAVAVVALIAALVRAYDQRDDALVEGYRLGEEIELYRDAAHNANRAAKWSRS